MVDGSDEKKTLYVLGQHLQNMIFQQRSQNKLEMGDIDILNEMRKQILMVNSLDELGSVLDTQNYEQHLKPLFSTYRQAVVSDNTNCKDFLKEYVNFIEKDWKKKQISDMLNLIENPPQVQSEEEKIAKILQRMEKTDKKELKKKGHLPLIGDNRISKDFGTLAEESLSFGNYEVAAYYFGKIIEKHAKFVMAYVGRGMCLGNTNKISDAITDFKTAIKLDPNCWQAHYNLGCLTLGKKDYASAITHFNNCLKIVHDFAPAYHNRGFTFNRLDMRDQAQIDFASYQAWKSKSRSSKFIFVRDIVE